MPLFAGRRLAHEPFQQSDDSAGTSLVCYRHIQIELFCARVALPF